MYFGFGGFLLVWFWLGFFFLFFLWGLGWWFFSSFALEQCSVSPGVKNKEVDYLPLKYDLIPKFPGQ